MRRPSAPRKSRKQAPARASARTRSRTLEDGGIPLSVGNLVHPRIGLGLWALGRWTTEDEGRTRATIERALELGFTWFDTAEVYGGGRSERVLGDELGRWSRPSFSPFVVTKVSWEHLRPSQLRAALVGSLQRLGRSSVDVYLVHAPDPRVPIPETMGAMEALYHEGKIRSIGVSNFSVEELEAANAALSGTQLVVNQVRYSLFDREEGDEILDYCQQHQIVIEAYTPLARGLLAGRYLEHETPSAEVRRYSSRLFERDRFQQLRSRARRLQDLADEAKVPMASIALHWLARRSVAPLFGASRPEQVDAVWEAWNAVPSDRVLDRADEIARGTGD